MEAVDIIINLVKEQSQKIPVLKKEDIDHAIERLSSSRGQQNSLTGTLADILPELSVFLTDQADYYGSSFERFMINIREQDPRGLEVSILHNNGFNACMLFHENNGSFTLVGKFSSEKQTTYNDSGIKAQNQANFTQALIHFEKGFEIADASKNIQADIKDRMATCCMELGRYKEAVAHWESALGMKAWDIDEQEAIEADIHKAKSLM